MMNGEDFKRLEQIVFNFKEEVKTEFRHQIGIQSENFQHKLDIVVEGHDVLRKEIRETKEELREEIGLVGFKVEALNQKIDTVKECLSKKLDAVAADLTAHRADTEVHKKVYKVKED
jgi:hypothetical protein